MYSSLVVLEKVEAYYYHNNTKEVKNKATNSKTNTK